MSDAEAVVPLTTRLLFCKCGAGPFGSESTMKNHARDCSILASMRRDENLSLVNLPYFGARDSSAPKTSAPNAHDRETNEDGNEAGAPGHTCTSGTRTMDGKAVAREAMTTKGLGKGKTRCTACGAVIGNKSKKNHAEECPGKTPEQEQEMVETKPTVDDVIDKAFGIAAPNVSNDPDTTGLETQQDTPDRLSRGVKGGDGKAADPCAIEIETVKAILASIVNGELHLHDIAISTTTNMLGTIRNVSFTTIERK